MRRARQLVDLLRNIQENDLSLGQHFLINDDLIDAAINYGEVKSSDHVLEIGPGPGVLTEALLTSGCKVTAIEIDNGAVRHLTTVFSEAIDNKQLTIISGDALKVKWPDSINKVIANIPYQISSPLIDMLTKYLRRYADAKLSKVILLVQEEFAERLVMEYDSDVGSLGMTVLLDWQCKILQKVPPHDFSPNPKVNSCFVEMTPNYEQLDCDKRLMKLIIHHAFKHRRKKLRTSFKSIPRRLNRIPNWYSQRWKQAYNRVLTDTLIDCRPEELGFDDWVEFCMTMEKTD